MNVFPGYKTLVADRLFAIKKDYYSGKLLDVSIDWDTTSQWVHMWLMVTSQLFCVGNILESTISVEGTYFPVASLYWKIDSLPIKKNTIAVNCYVSVLSELKHHRRWNGSNGIKSAFCVENILELAISVEGISVLVRSL